ncbi:AAA [Ectocarpus sp. CCAP 1310/34]|nr:AAA [Ectocarpus sp. CCAP 1310/34]
MVPGGGEEGTSIFDQDSEQSKPLLGDDYDRDGASSAALPAGAKKKVAEYLSAAEESVSVVHRVLHGLYGHLPREDVPRIVWLSLTLFAIIGGFWLLDSLKDTVLEGTVGLEYQPRAKLVSVAVTLLLVIQYNRLVDSCSKPTLFYILGACYTLLFLLVSLVLRTAPLGLANWGTRPARVIGWVSFVAIESYGSLAVALFWAFTNATVDLEAAKASYGLVIAGAQIGAIIGSTAATLPMHNESLHVWHLYAAGGLCPALMALLVRGYVFFFGNNLPRERLTNIQGTVDSALNGLKLVLRHQYVALLFGISCLYEVVLTILDYQMKVLGVEMFRETAGDEADERMASLMGHFGQTTNSLSLLMSLFGTSLCVRLLGLRKTLRIFPTLLVVAVVTSFFAPSLSFLFVAVAILKGLTYALNEPCKEMLYLPTSDAIKFKAKGWIDVFGSRCAKGVGSFVTLSSRGDRRRLATYGGVASFLISLILLGVSYVMGGHFDALIKSGEIVGAGEDGDDSGNAGAPPSHRGDGLGTTGGVELPPPASGDEASRQWRGRGEGEGGWSERPSLSTLRTVDV